MIHEKFMSRIQITDLKMTINEKSSFDLKSDTIKKRNNFYPRENTQNCNAIFLYFYTKFALPIFLRVCVSEKCPEKRG